MIKRLKHIVLCFVAIFFFVSCTNNVSNPLLVNSIEHVTPDPTASATPVSDPVITVAPTSTELPNATDDLKLPPEQWRDWPIVPKQLVTWRTWFSWCFAMSRT